MFAWLPLNPRAFTLHAVPIALSYVHACLAQYLQQCLHVHHLLVLVAFSLLAQLLPHLCEVVLFFFGLRMVPHILVEYELKDAGKVLVQLPLQVGLASLELPPQLLNQELVLLQVHEA
jgi:hypothetical protein